MLPKNNEIHIGLELEFDLPGYYENCDSRKKTFSKLKSEPYYYIQAENIDFSRTPSEAFELKLLSTPETFRERLSPILKEIKELGGFVDRYCGIHVHLDSRDCITNYDDKQICKTYDVLFSNLDTIYSKCKDYRKNSIYSRLPLKKVYNNPKKYGLEINKYYQTIEVRAKEACLDIEEIVDYVNTLQKLTGREEVK